MGIADIVCQSVNLTQWGYRLKNVWENFHGDSPACLGICAAVEAGDAVADSGDERSKDRGIEAIVWTWGWATVDSSTRIT